MKLIFLLQGEDILIIGGDEESLSPLLLHVYDKEIEFDMCRDETHKKRELFYGDNLDKRLVICGGVDTKVSISTHLYAFCLSKRIQFLSNQNLFLESLSGC